MAKKSESRVYAYAGLTHDHGFGHINVHVYEMFGYGQATLKLSCQTGSSSPSTEVRSYAWKCGVSNDYEVVGLAVLKKGYFLMRRIENQLEKVRRERGRPESFGEYVVEVLRAAGVRKLYVNDQIGRPVSNHEAFPCFDPLREGDDARNVLIAMENELLRRW